jgi:hypothetical protein
VARLHTLAPQLDGEPDPAFRAATRDRLVAMAAVRTPAPAPVSPLRRLLATRADDYATARWRTRLTAGLAGAALTVTALAVLVAVSADARPGDVLYGLKRGTEQTQLALASDASRGQTLLDFASPRLDEVRALVESGTSAMPATGAPAPTDGAVLAAGADPALVVQTLDTMDDQTTQGAAWLTGRAVTTHDAGPLGKLSDWAAVQSAGLAALRSGVPSAAQHDVDDSLMLLSDITGRADALRSSLACATGPATDGTDELGPVPAPCAPAAPATTAPGTGTTTQAPAGGTSTVPPPSAPGLPSTGTSGSGSGSGQGGTGTGGLPTSGLPTTPPGGGLPIPTPSLPSLPSVSVPSLPAAGNSSGPTSGLSLCVPPLVTIGNC